MSIPRQAALVAAFLLSACGGGGGDSPPAPPPAAGPTTPAEAVRTAARSTLDLLVPLWDLSLDLQIMVTTAGLNTAGSRACAFGGTRTTTWLRPQGDPAGGLLRRETIDCRDNEATTENGRLDITVHEYSAVAGGWRWRGEVRFTDWRITSSGRETRRNGLASGEGTVFSSISLGQPMNMTVSGMSLLRLPNTGGPATTLTIASMGVARETAATTRDLYALTGCASLSATSVSAELCVDAGSRIALLENVGTEQLNGRLRWNAGTPAGFDARLRASPSGATALRVELDLDNNGSFEASATLDRSTEIGLRI